VWFLCQNLNKKIKELLNVVAAVLFLCELVWMNFSTNTFEMINMKMILQQLFASQFFSKALINMKIILQISKIASHLSWTGNVSQIFSKALFFNFSGNIYNLIRIFVSEEP
jgi:hypothetical protein